MADQCHSGIGQQLAGLKERQAHNARITAAGISANNQGGFRITHSHSGQNQLNGISYDLVTVIRMALQQRPGAVELFGEQNAHQRMRQGQR